jgi:hypothetical protein
MRRFVLRVKQSAGFCKENTRESQLKTLKINTQLYEGESNENLKCCNIIVC